MSTRAWMSWGGGACVLAVAVFVLGTFRVHPSSLRPMTGSCATGLGTSARCAEWNGPHDGKRTCQTLGGTWRDVACPADATAAGGTCSVDRGAVQTRLRYGSAWAAAFRESTRAEHHCATQGGTYSR